MLIGLPDDEAARKLGSRLVSVKHVWDFWATGETYEQLHEQVKSDECRAKWVRSPFLSHSLRLVRTKPDRSD